jgi:hypothetical protein
MKRQWYPQQIFPRAPCLPRPCAYSRIGSTALVFSPAGVGRRCGPPTTSVSTRYRYALSAPPLHSRCSWASFLFATDPITCTYICSINEKFRFFFSFPENRGSAPAPMPQVESAVASEGPAPPQDAWVVEFRRLLPRWESLRDSSKVDDPVFSPVFWDSFYNFVVWHFRCCILRCEVVETWNPSQA